jgi:ribonuclease M5
MFKEVIVVEGRDDTRRMKEVFGEIETFETGGSALNNEKLAQIKALQENRGVIVFTDPDFPGQQIRNAIIEVVPEAKQAYLDQADARPKSGKGLGVEHASASAIREALDGAMTPVAKKVEHLSQTFLIRLDLIGHADSKQKRQLLANKLGIGYVNGKQLLNRLNMFGITEAQVLQALTEEV